jgi:uncharacterized membrane protein
MILWGAFWGAFLGWTLMRSEELGLIVGAIFGAIAGLTLRLVVRNEVQRTTDVLAQKLRASGIGFTASDSAPSPVRPQELGVQTSPIVSPAIVEPKTDVIASDVSLPLAESGIPQVNAAAQSDNSLGIDANIESSKRAPKENTPSASKQGAATPRARVVEPNAVEVLIGKAKAWLLGGNTVARVGAIVLFIGLSFLAKWAADNSLFPPEARLAGIGLVGIALLVQGARLSSRVVESDTTSTRSNYAILLQGVGVAVLYLTVFTAFKLYAMVPPLAAFATMALVCALSTVIALLRNTQALAFIGFAGAFASPILVSTGGGSHVALFSYYLILNIAITVIAYLRAWRALNLLGFLSTFIIATAWGATKYLPEQYASTQPFLIAFFAIYLAIGLFYALRHSETPKHTVDGMLVFGTPIVSFALQTQLVDHTEYGAAISAIVMSAVYVVLAFAIRRKTQPVAQWLTLSYAALGLIFATLAVPLALDGRLTAPIWAIEGAGVYWLATKQKRWMGQAFGIAMQVLAAGMFLFSFQLDISPVNTRAMLFANSHFVGAMMLSLSALAISWWAFAAARDEKTLTQTTVKVPDATILAATSIALFLVGFAWSLFGFCAEITSSAAGLRAGTELRLSILTFVTLAFVSFVAWRRSDWASARLPSYAVMPVMLLGALLGLAAHDAKQFTFDLLIWPVCIAMHLIMLRRVDRESPIEWWRVVHTANTLLIMVLLGSFLYRVIDVANLWRTDWAAIIMLVASTIVMAALASSRVWQTPAKGWPLSNFQQAYAVHAGSILAVVTGFGALIVACTARGNADPLPYIPFLNPVDLATFIALASVALWVKKLHGSTIVAANSGLRGLVIPGALAFVAFIVVNTVWLRFAHRFQSIPWRVDALFNSFFVQAGYSMLWTLLGVFAMVVAHRKGSRLIWQAGAGLLALTVAKLLLIDLANSGGGERIVAFIGVGILMVAVGYFAPMPPSKTKQSSESAAGGAA